MMNADKAQRLSVWGGGSCLETSATSGADGPRQRLQRGTSLAGPVRRRTLRTQFAAGCAILGLVVMFAAPTLARPMQVVTSTPAPEAIMRGAMAQFVVRFDGPVNHAQSRLEILHDGKVVKRLTPLLDSAPDVLFASSPELEPGHYVLHWSVKSIQDHDESEGTINFSVER